MKKILTLVLPAFILLSFFACHKDHTPPKPRIIITGTAMDCLGSLIDSGYVTIWVDDASNQYPLKKGAFTATIERNDTSIATVRIIPFDKINQRSGYEDTLHVRAGGDTIDVGRLVACKADQYVNGGVYYSTSVGSPPGTIYYTANNDSCTITAQSATGYGPLYFLIMPKLTGTGPVTMKYVGFSLSALDRWKGYGLSGTITEFGPVGGYISGTYSGMVRINDGDFNIHPDLPMSGNFHVKRTQ